LATISYRYGNIKSPGLVARLCSAPPKTVGNELGGYYSFLQHEAFGAVTHEVSTEFVSVVLSVGDSLMCRLDHVNHHVGKPIYFRYKSKRNHGTVAEICSGPPLTVGDELEQRCHGRGV
jgi:hypothetical protein